MSELIVDLVGLVIGLILAESKPVKKLAAAISDYIKAASVSKDR